jgi:hypothetical protein
MKFLIITNSNGKRRVKEHDFSSYEALKSKLIESGVENSRIFCEISDLIESLSSRVTALEKKQIVFDKINTNAPDKITSETSNVLQKAQPNSKFIRVELIEKNLVLEDYDLGIHEDQIEFQLHFHNISDAKIRAVKGDLVFHDLFDTEVFRIGVTMNNSIEPGKFSAWSGGFIYNEFIQEHVHFLGFKTDDLKLTLDNEKIVIKDDKFQTSSDNSMRDKSEEKKDIVDNIHPNVSKDIKLWGPKMIIINKKILKYLGNFSGVIDDENTHEFKIATSSVYIKFLDDCKKNKISSAHCPMPFQYDDGEEPNVPVSIVLYELAPKNLQSDAGNLKIGD